MVARFFAYRCTKKSIPDFTPVFCPVRALFTGHFVGG
jgi:hypothetical protein